MAEVQGVGEKRERSFAIIKPEGVAMGLVDEILGRIRGAGLVIDRMERVVFTSEQYDALYGHIREIRPNIYEPMKVYLTGNTSVILMVGGVGAVAKLLALRGSSNPSEAEPGTIRGDYAKDQDYVRLYYEGRPSLNIFHASASEEEAQRDLRVLFGVVPVESQKIMADYFFSASTGMFVSRRALAIDARVRDAGVRAGVQLDWDDEGRICRVTFNEARSLLDALGARMMTAQEYWKVLEDAEVGGDADMVASLTSASFAEWLNRVYLGDHTYIDNARVLGAQEFEGERNAWRMPKAGPGWFNPEGNINRETGEPVSVELSREKFATSWKYWSPHIGLAASPERTATAPIRGYVTSVGKPSFDLGIPTDARQPKLMIRECRTAPLQPVIDASVLAEAEHLITERDDEKLVAFVERHGGLFASSYDSQIYRLREQMLDRLGAASFAVNVKTAGRVLSGNADARRLKNSFLDYTRNARQRLEEALDKKGDLVFVMGHKNPDTDAVVSSLFEAWRNHLLNGEHVTYVPIVQCTRIPDEVATLLGDLADILPRTSDLLYALARKSGLARWISVDQNREPEVQKYFVAIIDHHVVSETARSMNVPKTLEMTGSSSALVARKILGMGVELEASEARVLYGAALMDTENRVAHKMTPQDAKIMDRLKSISGIGDDTNFYQSLMARLLSTTDAELLFRRDYKEDWGFGFAVAKVKDRFRTPEGTGLVTSLCALATENTRSRNLPLTLLKVTDYRPDNVRVNKERVYFAFSANATPQFRDAVRRSLEAVVKFEFPGSYVEANEDFVEFSGTGMQLSRKKTAPILQPVVAAFNRYFQSPSTKLWVKRDFLRNTQTVKTAVPGLSTDSEGRVNYVTFSEAKNLAKKMKFKMLSISEYWKVLGDAKAVNDAQMTESLQGSNFVEFWDTAILGHDHMVDHPHLVGGKVQGAGLEVTVPAGSPGLVSPKDVDPTTGIPLRVHPPNDYVDPTLWRYWEPDSSTVFPCRSYIFLLNQPSWDGKFHLADSLPNLGVRPAVDTVTEPKVDTKWDADYLTVSILEEDELHQFKWPKKIADYLDIE